MESDDWLILICLYHQPKLKRLGRQHLERNLLDKHGELFIVIAAVILIRFGPDQQEFASSTMCVLVFLLMVMVEALFLSASASFE